MQNTRCLRCSCRKYLPGFLQHLNGQLLNELYPAGKKGIISEQQVSMDFEHYDGIYPLLAEVNY